MTAALAPGEVSLTCQADVMEAIEASIRSGGGSLRQACRNARIGASRPTQWRQLICVPTMGKLAALAAEAGYEIVMLRDGVAINVLDQAAIMAALDEARRAAKLSIFGLDESLGVPGRSWSYWRYGRRQPPMLPLALLATSLGFQILMRRKNDVRRSDGARLDGLDGPPARMGAA